MSDPQPTPPPPRPPAPRELVSSVELPRKEKKHKKKISREPARGRGRR